MKTETLPLLCSFSFLALVSKKTKKKKGRRSARRRAQSPEAGCGPPPVEEPRKGRNRRADPSPRPQPLPALDENPDFRPKNPERAETAAPTRHRAAPRPVHPSFLCPFRRRFGAASLRTLFSPHPAPDSAVSAMPGSSWRRSESRRRPFDLRNKRGNAQKRNLSFPPRAGSPAPRVFGFNLPVIFHLSRRRWSGPQHAGEIQFCSPDGGE